MTDITSTQDRVAMNQKLRSLSKNVFEASIKLSLDSKHSLPKREKIKSMMKDLNQMLEILETERSAPLRPSTKISADIHKKQ